MDSFSDTTAHRSLMVLAPADACLRRFSGRITRSSELHSQLIEAMQRHRGRIYRDDGAIAESDLKNERHISPLDPGSWHLLIMGVSGTILGCTRLHRHRQSVSAEDLSVSRAPIAQCQVWGGRFRATLHAELGAARRAGLACVEVGGWALDPSVRGTIEALKIVLATYALGQIQGGALALGTATRRHGSAGILRRLGAEPLQWMGTEIPAYYDESYGCEMEVLRFDSRRPNPRYAPMIRDLLSLMTRLPVICPGEETSRWPALLRGSFGVPAHQRRLPALAM